jgi:4-amino-4-deoxy-L-arabinose transferase-like glycosyltransferase/membrane-associated phospholipid phosphatase
VSKSRWLNALRELGKPLAPAWLLLLWGWAGGRDKRRAAVVGIAAMLLAAPLVNGLKQVPRRLRPDQVSKRAAVERDDGLGSYSYPSGDATTAFAAAGVAAAFVGWPGRATLLLAAALVAALRVASMRHYPADVLAGAAVGLFCAWVALHLGRGWLGRGPPVWLRRRSWIVTGLAALAFADVASKRPHVLTFLSAFGPFVAAWLLATKGPAWLRWARCRGLGGASAWLAGEMPPRRGHTGLAVLLAVVALAVLPCLGWTTLWDRDEGYYVECAREMLERREPFVPHFSGEPWLEKPPLSYWLMAASMGLLGDSEFAGRLPSALMGLAAMGLTFQLGRRLYSASAGLLAALILGASFLFTMVMRFALMDTPLTCCVLFSHLGLCRLIQGERRGGLLLFWLGCGLGVLTKGPLGLALPVIGLAGFIFWAGRWRLATGMRPLPGLLLVTAITAVWAVPASWLTRGEYFWELVWVRTLEPVFLTSLHGHGGGNVLGYLALVPAYVPVLIVGLLPWTGFLPPAVRLVCSDGRRSDRAGLLLGWPLAQLAVFSLVRTKLVHHVLPIVPPLAVVLGAFFADVVARRSALSERVGRAWLAVSAVLTLLGAACIVAVPFFLHFPGGWPWFAPSALVAAAATPWILRSFRRSRDGRPLVATASLMLVCVTLIAQVAMPYLDRHKPARQIAAFLENAFGRNTLLGMRLGWVQGGGFNDVSLVYYLKRPIAKIADGEDLAAFLSSAERSVVILSEKKLSQMTGGVLTCQHRRIWEKPVWISEKNRWVNMVVLSNR